MNEKPQSCFGCPLYSLGQGFALTDGAGTSGVLVVAEALGEDEARRGLPLVGRAGQTWDRVVSRTTDPVLGKLGRDHFKLANVISCRPPNNELVKAPYESAAIEHCRRHLEGVIKDFKPKAILTLGNVPLRWFTGEWGIEQLRGYIFDTPWAPVVPTYHPSYIQRGKWQLARVVQLDILKALEVSRKGAKSFFVDKDYTLSPGYHEVGTFLADWRAAGRPPLAFDIETPHSEAAKAEDMVFEDDASYQILMVSLAWEPFKAISIPWIEPFIGMLKEAFAEDAQFLVWNAKFDVPRLMASGVHFGGEVIDVMLAWHWLEPALPMGLKYVATFFCPDMSAWKLAMHSNFQWYNAADSDVLLRVFLGTRERLEAQGRWRTFLRHFVEYNKILLRMSERGITVDHERRAAAREHFGTRLEGVVAAAQQLAPREILGTHPKRGYAKPPADPSGMVQILVELNEAEELRERKKVEREKAKQAEAFAKEQRKAARAAAKAAKEESRRLRAEGAAARKAAKQSARRNRRGVDKVLEPAREDRA